MERKTLMLAGGVILIIAGLSILNTAVVSITGSPIMEISNEFPGLSMLFILVIGVVGIFAIRKRHK